MSTSHERPGVYASFTASSLIQGRSGAKVVGAVGRAETGTALEVSVFYSAAEAEAAYGPSSSGRDLVDLVRVALQNGCGAVAAVPAAIGSSPTTSAYNNALAVLAKEDVDIVICDSSATAVHKVIRTHLESCAENRRERIAVVAATMGETVSELIERAEALNSERMVLTAPSDTALDGSVTHGVLAAAAVAGAIAGERDPAVPLSGAVLQGLTGLETHYTDSELDSLILGGVTPLEAVGGEISVIRGITTRTTTNDAADSTWRELNTILIIDDVIPQIRETLRARFIRCKNTLQTRTAIASQVVILLENKVKQEIIDSYGDVSVTADGEDPTRCLVEFPFTVAHGLNQIHIMAHITV